MQSATLNLTPLRDALLELYSAIAQVCDKNNIRYYVGYGTALGAVRHHGFIPWDDDFDIMMPRCDYDRFIRLASSQLPSYLKIVNWKNTPEFGDYLFGKVQDVRRGRVDSVFAQCGRPVGHGIFIDIYPIDGFPKLKISQMLLSVRLRLIRIWVWSGVMRGKFPMHKGVYPNCSPFRRLVAFVVSVIFYPWLGGLKSDGDLASYFDSFIRKWEFHDDGLAASWWRTTSSPVGTVWPSCVFASGVDLAFGAGKVRCPLDFNNYLKIRYGDYMKMPPEEMRVPGHIGDGVCPWVYGPTTDELPY